MNTVKFADFIIHLGDLTHQPSADTKIVEQFNNLPIATYHCIGNHECHLGRVCFKM